MEFKTLVIECILYYVINQPGSWLKYRIMYILVSWKLLPCGTFRRPALEIYKSFGKMYYFHPQNNHLKKKQNFSQQWVKMLCLLGRASLWYLKNKRPTWCHLLFYFTSYVLNMFRTLIYPSSGACDYSVELPHWSCCSWFDVCWSFGVVELEWYPCCRLKHNYFSL